MKKQQQKRATFNDVSYAQEKLLSFVDNCIKKNKPLNEKDRKEFVRNYRNATLGLGSEYKFIIDGKNQSYDLGHLGHAAYWIAHRNNKIVKMKDEEIEIKHFWLKLRDMLFVVFDPAVELAVKISKEQTRLGVSEAAEV